MGRVGLLGASVFSVKGVHFHVDSTAVWGVRDEA